MATAVVKSAKSAAPGQYLGYGLQDVRLCRHLLTASTGCVVSLEYVDDTAIHRPDGAMMLEQSKSAVSASNPVADSSIELWKCFANWASLCADGEVRQSTTRFRLYVCPKKHGPLVLRLHAASDIDEAKAILTTIAKKITPSTKLKGCNPKITEFLGAGEEICTQIILNFRLVMGDDPLEPIREVLRLHVLNDALDDFCAHAIGMAKNQIAALIRAKLKPQIDADRFRQNLRGFIRKHGALGLLMPTTGKPTPEEVDQTLSTSPIFVQQLVRVKMATEHVVRAVSDYLRSTADQTLWAADGQIVEESLNELHDTLEAHFQNTRDEIEELHGAHDAETRGRQVYRRCVSHQAPLQGLSVPGYFIPGSFNMLADAMRVGWHPNYADFFPGE